MFSVLFNKYRKKKPFVRDRWKIEKWKKKKNKLGSLMVKLLLRLARFLSLM